jgi:ACS family sodium-dependent inorganic phosphate cotransporter
VSGIDDEIEFDDGELLSTMSADDRDTTMSMPVTLTMACLCWGVALLSALDRVAMSVAVLPMSSELGFTETIKGQVASMLSYGYGLAILPCGLLVACVSPRLLLGAGLFLWSLSTIMTPITAAAAGSDASLVPLFLARMSVGAAESAVLPSVQRLVSNWVSAEQKSLAMAFIFSGFQCGTITAYLLSPIVMEYANGWRGLFYVYGAVGLLYCVPWMLLSRDSPNTPSSKQAEVEEIVNGLAVNGATTKESSLQAAPWIDFVKSPAVWGMTLAHAANNWGLYNSLAWTPTFYAEQYGLSVRDSAFLAVLPSVAGAVGGLVAGTTADKIIQRMESPKDGLTRLRKIYQSIALCGPALCLATLSTHIPEQPWVAQALLTGTVGLQAFNAAGYAAANQEKAGEKWTGLLYSLTSLPGVMVGSFAVALTGQILDATQQDWSLVFGLNAAVDCLGAAAFAMLYNSKQEFD